MKSMKLNKLKMWMIKIFSKKDLSNEDRDFIAEFVSEEARKRRIKESFIFHEMIESKRYCDLFLEIKKSLLVNLVKTLNEYPLLKNSYKISYKRLFQ